MKVKFSRVAALLAVCVLLVAMTPAAAAPAAPAGWSQYSQASPPIPTGASINAVTTVSATDAWAVGDNSQVYHWTGTTWSAVTTNIPAGLSLNSVVAVPGAASPTAWVVGQPDTGNPSLVMLCSTTSCTRQAIPTSATKQLDSVWAVSANDVWAFGDAGTILHYNGTSWLDLTGTFNIPAVQYHMVQMLSATEGWAVGGPFAGLPPKPGVLLHYTGGAWQDVTSTLSPLPSLPLVGLFFNSANEGWAVGGDNAGGGNAIVYHYLNGNWSNDNPNPSSGTLFWYVWSGAAGTFAVGNGGQIFQRTGANTWSPVFTLNNSTLYGVWLTSNGSSGWAVGAAGSTGIFVQYTGSVITPCPGCTPKAFLPFVTK